MRDYYAPDNDGWRTQIAAHNREEAQCKQHTPAAETPTQNANIPGRKGFQPGRSGNPAGRPRNPANSFQLQQMAREKSGAAIQFLSSTMLNSKVSINVRVNAAIELLNRGFGKPHQSMDINHGVQNDLAALLE